MDDLWDIARVAEYLAVCERTVYNKVRSGDLPATKVGRLWRVSKSDLDAWLRAGRERSSGLSPAGPASASQPAGTSRMDATRSLPTRADLVALLAGVEAPLRRRLLFVGLLSEAAEALGWRPPVIVGGNAVEFYTFGEYATQDIDLAGSSEPIVRIMSEWGFARQGRHWYDGELGLVLEVPGSTLNPEALDHVVAVNTDGVTAHVIGIEDLIVDRLAACVSWKDEESCRYARVLLEIAADLDDDYLSRRVREEQLADAFVTLENEARR